jgi:hypothetical protein
MIVFSKCVTDLPNSEIEKIFNINNTCLLYFDTGEDEDDEDRKEIMGTYPGPINNFLLTGSSESWTDTEDLYTNIYLKKDIRENADYLIIPKDIYLIIKQIFGISNFNEIIRKTVLNSDNQLHIEVNLAKVFIIKIKNLTDKSALH